MRGKNKIDLLMALFATGPYRVWFWQNYKNDIDQRKYRESWSALANYSLSDIRFGMDLWISRFGNDCPPVPDAFCAMLSSQRESAKRNLKSIKQWLVN